MNITICGALELIFLLDCYPTVEKMIREFRSFAKILIALVSVPAIALGYFAAFNYITNGNVLASPYLFQDSNYSAISFRHMKVWEILFSSWHGLFFYHPLLAVPIYWLLRSKKESTISFIILAAVIIQVVIQSSWYAWWMGLGTYGARGFCGVSVILIYGVMRCNQDQLMAVLNSSRNLIILAMFATFEANLIRQGETNFTDYASFLDTVTWPLRPFFWAGLIVFIGRWLAWDSRRSLLAYILGLFPLNVLFRLRHSGDFGGFLESMVGGWHLPTITLFDQTLLPSYVFFGAIIVAAIMVLTARSLFHLTLLRGLVIPMSNISSKLKEHFVFASAIGVLLLSIILQNMMLKRFSDMAISNFPGGRSFDCKVLNQTFHEYGLVTGYEQDQAAMFSFLTKAGCLGDDTGYYQ